TQPFYSFCIYIIKPIRKLMKTLKTTLLITCSLFFLVGCNNDDDSPAVDNQENIPENNALEIGDYHEGGVIIYLDATGEHGLVCSITDLTDGNTYYAIWNGGVGDIPGADGTEIGTGKQNTIDILNGYIQGNGPNAAGLCAYYSVIIDGERKDGWFLPSKDELNLLFIHKDLINATAVANGGTEIGNERYWSSSEYDADYAWKQALYDNGGQYAYWKPTYSDRVRAVREF
ncbi:MAG TPA: hypothetical protein DCM10_10775, partial [Xanthomarina gelatinilytica]|nr:hypothetical protein [Xanthomarina gelatinilytica]